MDRADFEKPANLSLELFRATMPLTWTIRNRSAELTPKPKRLTTKDMNIFAFVSLMSFVVHFLAQ